MPSNDRSVELRITAKNLSDAAFKDVLKGLGRIEESSKKTTTKVSSLQRGFSSLGKAAPGALRAVAKGATATAAAIIAAGVAVVKLGQKGSELAALETGFQNLTAAAGESGKEMLRLATTATSGLISQFDLMAAANKGLLLGLPITEESMGDLAKSAIVLGRAMGQDASKSLDDLITALGRASPLILDNLGLTVKVGEANAIYAEKLGKTAAQLTEAEKKTAFYEATLVVAGQKVKELGGIQLTFGDIIRQGSVFVINLRDDLAKMIAKSPVLIAGLKGIVEALNRAFGSETRDKAIAMTNAIERSSFFVIGLAQAGIKTAQILTQGFAALQAVFLGVGLALSKVQTVFAETAAAGLEAASRVPVLGDAYRMAAEEARAAATGSADFTAALGVQLDEVLRAAAGNDELGVSLQANSLALDQINMAMVNAGTTQGNLTTSTANLTARTNEQTSAVGTALASLTAVPPLMTEVQTSIDMTGERVNSFADNVRSAFVSNSEVTTQFGITVTRVGGEVFVQTQKMEAAYAQFGLKTQAQMKLTAATAKANFEIIKKEGKLTAEELTKIWDKYQKSRLEQEGTATTGLLKIDETWQDGATKIFQEAGGSFKQSVVAGIALAIQAAVAKALAAAPFPFNLALAAGAAAAGALVLNKARSLPIGFAEGTPDSNFVDFGRATPTVLHGREAVINEAGVPSLADQIARSQSRMKAPARGDDRMGARMDAIAAGLEALPGTIERAIRDGVLLAV